MKPFTLFRQRPDTRKQPLKSVRPLLELLETRNLMSFANVLVNNPAEDVITKQDTQSETAVVLGADSNVVVAYNDTGIYSAGVSWHLTGYSVSSDGGNSFTD
jgi:hypothetical protein